MEPSSPPSAPWPVRKGIFRSTGQSDFIPQRTPSPIVEMPATPAAVPTNHHPNANPMSPLGSPRCIPSGLDAKCMSPPPQSPVIHHYGPHHHHHHHASRVSSPVKSPTPPVIHEPTPAAAAAKSKLKSRTLPPINVSIREIPIEVQQEVFKEAIYI